MPQVTPLLHDEPTTIGEYRLTGRLGSGGQGTVYAGETPDGVRVAVKLLHPHLTGDHQERARFLREVELAKRVAPFCTAQVLDMGLAGERPYIVSEFVEGTSLHDSVQQDGPRSATALQRLAINTAIALDAIHQAGVVHRDFNPRNVLLGPDGPVVIDFGISTALDVSRSVLTSQAVGTPAYMSPEQIANRDVRASADLFAWAASMIYAATGQRAFPGDSIPATMHAILYTEPDLSRFDSRLRELMAACLAKEPARRPTAAQVVERLRGLATPAWENSGAEDVERTRPPRTRRQAGLAAGVAVAVAAVATYLLLSLVPVEDDNVPAPAWATAKATAWATAKATATGLPLPSQAPSRTSGAKPSSISPARHPVGTTPPPRRTAKPDPSATPSTGKKAPVEPTPDRPGTSSEHNPEPEPTKAPDKSTPKPDPAEPSSKPEPEPKPTESDCSQWPYCLEFWTPPPAPGPWQPPG